MRNSPGVTAFVSDAVTRGTINTNASATIQVLEP